MTEKLIRDVHPADVLMPDGRLHRNVRVFVTSERLVAYRTVHGWIEVAFDVALEQPCSVPANRGTLGTGRLEARLADGGGTAWVNASGGCGCGSPLKGLAAPVRW